MQKVKLIINPHVTFIECECGKVLVNENLSHEEIKQYFDKHFNSIFHNKSTSSEISQVD